MSKNRPVWQQLCAKLMIITLLFCTVLIPDSSVSALAKAGQQIKIMNIDGVNARPSPDRSQNRVAWLGQGTIVNVKEVVTGEDSGYGTTWYKIYYDGPTPEGGTYKGDAYIFATDDTGMQQIVDQPATPAPTPTPYPTPDLGPVPDPIAPGTNVYTDREWQDLLAGFPASYHASLNDLHKKHPSWKFTPKYYPYSLDQAVATERSVHARNLVPYNYYAYRDNADKTQYDAGGWYAASDATMYFVMDPRNWLTEKYAFMFKRIDDIETSSDTRRLQIMFEGNAYLTQMIPDIVNASRAQGISSIFTGTRIKTEIAYTRDDGVKTVTRNARGEIVLSAQECALLGLPYYPDTKYYNVFNIGAYQGTDPQKNSILYAMGYNLSETTKQNLMIPWTNYFRAVYGGVSFIKNDYVSAGQNTNYLMKYNLRQDLGSFQNNVWHQYMGNAFAPSTEASIQYSVNLRANAMDDAFTFDIPVFQNMPGQAYPNPGSIYADTVPPQQAAGGDEKVPIITAPSPYAVEGDVIDFKDIYVMRSSPSRESSRVFALGESELATIKGRVTGEYINGLGDQWYYVQFQNYVGYIIAYPPEQPIVKKAGSNPAPTPAPAITETTTAPSEKPQTGLRVMGDVNGDGKVTISDAVSIQRYLLGLKTLDEAAKAAADVNKSGSVTISDAVKIQRYLLGMTSLE